MLIRACQNITAQFSAKSHTCMAGEKLNESETLHNTERVRKWYASVSHLKKEKEKMSEGCYEEEFHKKFEIKNN